MQNVTFIGFDLGKHSFHIHYQEKSGKALLRKSLLVPNLLIFWLDVHRPPS